MVFLSSYFAHDARSQEPKICAEHYSLLRWTQLYTHTHTHTHVRDTHKIKIIINLCKHVARIVCM